LPELPGRRKTGAFESLAGQNAEPALHLIGPGGVRGREVEMHLRVSLEPSWGVCAFKLSSTT
jgi:hypothetical protein